MVSTGTEFGSFRVKVVPEQWALIGRNVQFNIICLETLHYYFHGLYDALGRSLFKQPASTSTAALVHAFVTAQFDYYSTLTPLAFGTCCPHRCSHHRMHFYSWTRIYLGLPARRVLSGGFRIDALVWRCLLDLAPAKSLLSQPEYRRLQLSPLNRSGTHCLFCKLFHKADPWLIPFCGISFHWHYDCSRGFIWTHSSLAR